MNRFLLLITLLTFAFCSPSCKQEDDGGNPIDVKRTIKPTSFLSEEYFDKLYVEVQYMPGYKPSDETLSYLKDFLTPLLNKSAGIEVVAAEGPGGGSSSYYVADVRDFEENNRVKEEQDGTQLNAYILITDGEYADNEGDSKVLGIAYGKTSMVLFGPSLDEFTGGIGQPSKEKLSKTVICHEFGHVLGLVNTGTEMVSNHQDSEHGAHCDNEDCLMYWTAESSAVVGKLFGGDIPELDANCRADLTAAGGK